MNSAPVFIHAGAHRTGTSSFQMCLHTNRIALSDAGYAAGYPQRDGIPSGNLALRLPGPRHSQSEFAEFANQAQTHFEMIQGRTDKPLILSEENIPGRMLHFFQGQFYPAAEDRLKVLRLALGTREIRRLVLVVRSYDQIFVSGFRKRAEDKLVDPFASLRDAMMKMDRGWVELVQAIKDILDPSEFIVLPYEARGSSTRLLHRLVPELDETALREPKKPLNLSATDAALITLQAFYRKGHNLPRAKLRKIIQAHSNDKTRRGFAEFTADQKSRLRKKYLIDLLKIREMSDIHFMP